MLIHLSRTVGDKANPFRLEFCLQKQSGSSQQNAVPLELCRFVALFKRRATDVFDTFCQFVSFKHLDAFSNMSVSCEVHHDAKRPRLSSTPLEKRPQQGFTPCTWGPIADADATFREGFDSKQDWVTG